MAKLNKWLFERQFPDAPWLAESAVYLLDTWLRPTDRGIEWGAGRSTVWFASRVEHLTSIESNQQWYEHTERLLREKGHENVDLRFISLDGVTDATMPESHPYSDIADEMPDGSLDFALVDGIKLRLLCMEKVIPKIKLGGLLILDNAERFFPDTIMGKHTVILEPRDRCINESWEEIERSVQKWRALYTTSGISNTLIWIRPID